MVLSGEKYPDVLHQDLRGKEYLWAFNGDDRSCESLDSVIVVALAWTFCLPIVGSNLGFK